VAHENADRLMPLLLKQVRSDAAVNATRHGNYNSRHQIHLEGEKKGHPPAPFIVSVV
jgi:hypothetical protein